MPQDDLKPIIPQGWRRARGFSYGIDGGNRRSLHVSGQLAADSGAAAPRSDLSFAEQFVKSLGNVVAVVGAAGGEPTDIAILRVFVTDISAFKAAQEEIAAGWRELLGSHFPAMTMVEVTRLFEETALVEIEATALLKREIQ